MDPKNRSEFKILFLTFFEENGSHGYPTGILYLSSYLKQAGFSNISYLEEQLSHTMLLSPAVDINAGSMQIYSILLQNPPDILFIGPIFSYCLPYVPKIIAKLKIQLPQVPIFLGGYHFGANICEDQRFLKEYCPQVEGILIGKAEETILEVVETIFQRLNQNSSITNELSCDNLQAILDNIQGLLTLNNKYIPLIPKIQVDQLPLPDYGVLFTNPFRGKYTLAERKNPRMDGDTTWFDAFIGDPLEYGIIVGSRGCPYDCAFCSGARSITAQKGEVIRQTRHADHIFEEIMSVYRQYGTRLFLFSDPLFMESSRSEITRISRLVELITLSGIQFRFIIEMRVDVINRLDESLLSHLIRAGFIVFNLGLEKGTDKGLKYFLKHITTRDQRQAIQKLRSASKSIKIPIIINGTFILGGPKESFWGNLKTIVYALRLGLDHVKFFILELYPNTRLYMQALDNQILEAGIEPYLSRIEFPHYYKNFWQKKYLPRLLQLAMKLELKREARVGTKETIKKETNTNVSQISS